MSALAFMPGHGWIVISMVWEELKCDCSCKSVTISLPFQLGRGQKGSVSIDQPDYPTDAQAAYRG